MEPKIQSTSAEDGVSVDPSSSLSINISGRDLDRHPDIYPAKQHARRVAAHLPRHGLIYLPGQQTRPLEDSDQDRPFCQRRYFFYLSGVVEPDCHLTFDTAADRLTLYVPNFDLRRAIWMGPTLRREQALDKYDVNEVKYYSTLAGDIMQWMAEHGSHLHIYVLHKDQKPDLRADHRFWTDWHALQPAMDACRVIKDDHEIDLIKRANEVSAAAHTAVLRRISSMSSEAQIHGCFLDTCVSRGARNQAYEIIAAAGRNAATLHYTRNDEPLRGKPLVCLDAGAEWDCYASDVTRTFPRAGHWPSEQAERIYAVVQRMQEACIARVREGVRYLDLHWLAHDIAIEELLHLGIFRRGSSVDEVRESGASLVFFPHGLGHHVGLEVHDVSPEPIMAGDTTTTTTTTTGSSSTSQETTMCPELEEASKTYLSPCTAPAPVLKAGMVVTIEPGIYFSRLALDDARSKPHISKYIDMEVVQKYIPMGGVRIEDDVLVTEDGFVNLTTAPKGQDMLDVIRRGSDSR